MKSYATLLLLAVAVVACTLAARSRGAFAQTGSAVVVAMPLPSVGAQCTIHFRRDALGLAARTAVPPDAVAVGESRLTISGQLRGLDTHWVAISRGKDESRVHWVNRASVLSIEASLGN